MNGGGKDGIDKKGRLGESIFYNFCVGILLFCGLILKKKKKGGGKGGGKGGRSRGVDALEKKTSG